MLPPANRLVEADLFRLAVRSGARAGSRTLVVHLRVPSGGVASDAPDRLPPARIGLVVSKAVGNAVVRNRVKRRLRHLAREHVSSLPGSAVLVVRALPAAAEASYDGLGEDLARSLGRAVREVDQRSAPVS